MKARAQFLKEKIVCRHGIPIVVSVDGGPENKGAFDEELDRFKISKIFKFRPATLERKEWLRFGIRY